MEKIISFVVDNWKLVAELCAALFCLVMFLVRKKPVKVIDSIYQEITSIVIKAVSVVERPGDGSSKRAEVLAMVLNWLGEKHPDIEYSRYMEFASNLIEDILSTPKKKGE